MATPLSRTRGVRTRQTPSPTRSRSNVTRRTPGPTRRRAAAGPVEETIPVQIDPGGSRRPPSLPVPDQRDEEIFTFRGAPLGGVPREQVPAGAEDIGSALPVQLGLRPGETAGDLGLPIGERADVRTFEGERVEPLVRDLEPASPVEGVGVGDDSLQAGREALQGGRQFQAGLQDVFAPQLEFLRSQQAEAQRAREARGGTIDFDLRGEVGQIREDLTAAFEPAFRRLSEDEERASNLIRRTAAGAGSARGTRASEREVQVRDQFSIKREALAAQQRLEERRLTAAARGASDQELQALDTAVNNARESVLKAEQNLAQIEAGLTEETIQQQEAGRQFDLEFQLDSQDALRKTFEAETGRQKVDQNTQVQLAKLAAEIPAGQSLQVGDFNVTGIFTPEPDFSLLKTKGPDGDNALVLLNKNTGDIQITPIGELVAPAPAAAGVTGGGGGGGFTGGGGSGQFRTTTGGTTTSQGGTTAEQLGTSDIASNLLDAGVSLTDLILNPGEAASALGISGEEFKNVLAGVAASAGATGAVESGISPVSKFLGL